MTACWRRVATGRSARGRRCSTRTPLHIVRGDGVYLFDADGRRYVDMYNNVPCVGHANPHVVEAMTRQQGTLNVHSRYLHEGIVDFAERLTALHGPAIESVVFSCTGTEANEVALRMARFATGKRGIVCTNATYHGNSEAVGELTRIARRTAEQRRTCARFRFPRSYRPLVPGAQRGRAGRGLSRAAAARRSSSLERDGAGFAGADRLLDLRQRRTARRPARLHGRARRRWCAPPAAW